MKTKAVLILIILNILVYSCEPEIIVDDLYVENEVKKNSDDLLFASIKDFKCKITKLDGFQNIYLINDSNSFKVGVNYFPTKVVEKFAYIPVFAPVKIEKKHIGIDLKISGEVYISKSRLDYEGAGSDPGLPTVLTKVEVIE